MGQRDKRHFKALTLITCILTGSFLSLTIKKAGDSILILAGRCTIAVLGGIIVTKYLIWHFMKDFIMDEAPAIALASISALVCVLSFFVAVEVLKLFNRSVQKVATLS